MLRQGNAGSNTAADHIAVARAACAQLPGHRPGRRPGKTVLIRTDGAGATHAFLNWLTGQRVQYSIGFTLPTDFADHLTILNQADVWSPALDADELTRPDAMVADATGLLDLTAWPAGTRVIVRKEKPHPGAQLQITDVDGWRVTAFATNTPATAGPRRTCAHLELRHRRRARCEDRIRIAKETGLTNLPLHDFDQNRIWLAVVALAVELTAWWQDARIRRPSRTPVGAETPTPAAVQHRPGASPSTAEPDDCTCRPTRRGPGYCWPGSIDCTCWTHPPDQRPATGDNPRNPDRPVDPATTRPSANHMSQPLMNNQHAHDNSAVDSNLTKRPTKDPRWYRTGGRPGSVRASYRGRPGAWRSPSTWAE